MSCCRSTVTDVREPVAKCIFCGASSERGFDVVFEDQDYIVFNDRSPAAEHHILVVPKIHIANVKVLKKTDIPMLTTMKEIGNRIFDDLDVQPGKRRFGFHIPPFYSVDHLHLHLLALPSRGIRKFGWHVSKGKDGKTKGFGWFVEVDQVIEILQQGKTVTVFPC